MAAAPARGSAATPTPLGGERRPGDPRGVRRDVGLDLAVEDARRDASRRQTHGGRRRAATSSLTARASPIDLRRARRSDVARRRAAPRDARRAPAPRRGRRALGGAERPRRARGVGGLARLYATCWRRRASPAIDDAPSVAAERGAQALVKRRAPAMAKKSGSRPPRRAASPSSRCRSRHRRRCAPSRARRSLASSATRRLAAPGRARVDARAPRCRAAARAAAGERDGSRAAGARCAARLQALDVGAATIREACGDGRRAPARTAVARWFVAGQQESIASLGEAAAARSTLSRSRRPASSDVAARRARSRCAGRAVRRRITLRLCSRERVERRRARATRLVSDGGWRRRGAPPHERARPRHARARDGPRRILVSARGGYSSIAAALSPPPRRARRAADASRGASRADGARLVDEAGGEAGSRCTRWAPRRPMASRRREAGEAACVRASATSAAARATRRATKPHAADRARRLRGVVRAHAVEMCREVLATPSRDAPVQRRPRARPARRRDDGAALVRHGLCVDGRADARRDADAEGRRRRRRRGRALRLASDRAPPPLSRAAGGDGALPTSRSARARTRACHFRRGSTAHWRRRRRRRGGARPALAGEAVTGARPSRDRSTTTTPARACAAPPDRGARAPPATPRSAATPRSKRRARGADGAPPSRASARGDARCGARAPAVPSRRGGVGGAIGPCEDAEPRASGWRSRAAVAGPPHAGGDGAQLAAGRRPDERVRLDGERAATRRRRRAERRLARRARDRRGARDARPEATSAARRSSDAAARGARTGVAFGLSARGIRARCVCALGADERAQPTLQGDIGAEVPRRRRGRRARRARRRARARRRTGAASARLPRGRPGVARAASPRRRRPRARRRARGARWRVIVAARGEGHARAPASAGVRRRAPSQARRERASATSAAMRRPVRSSTFAGATARRRVARGRPSDARGGRAARAASSRPAAGDTRASARRSGDHACSRGARAAFGGEWRILAPATPSAMHGA